MKWQSREILDLGKDRHLDKEEFLFNAMDPADALYLVKSGSLRVYNMDEQGREMEIVRLGPGDFLGEAIVFAASSFPFFAQASERSHILIFEKRDIFDLIDQSPSAARYFIELMAQKCIVLNKRMEALGLMTVRQRLIHYFLSQCHGVNRCRIRLEIKKAELAGLLGTISETLSRNLRHLQEDGLIEVNGRTITICDCCRLRSEIQA